MLPDDLATPIGAVAPVAVIGSIIVKSTAILLLGVVCAMTARAASAAARHLIWTLTLAGAMVVPAAAAVVPAWHVPALRWLAAAWPFLLQTDAARATAAASTDAVLAPPMPAASRASTPTRAAVRHERGERESVVPVRAMTAASTPVAVVAADAAVEAEVAMAAVGGGGAASTPGLQVTADAVAAATPAANWARLAQWAVVVWISGVVVTLALTIMGLLRLAAIGRRARPMLGGRWALLAPTAMRELDVRRRVRFLELDHAMPMTWGVLRPVVLLPSGDFESTIAQRLDVLRHELAHVRRYDCLTQLVGQLACAVYWFNPLVWLAARQLRVERERACDDEVLRAGSKASDYAEYLLRVARTMQMPGVAAFGGLAMARPSQLAGRLRAVLDDARHRDRLSATIAARAVLAALAVVTGVASVAPAPMDAKAARPTIASAPARPVVTTTSTNGRGITPVVAGAPE